MTPANSQFPRFLERLIRQLRTQLLLPLVPSLRPVRVRPVRRFGPRRGWAGALLMAVGLSGLLASPLLAQQRAGSPATRPAGDQAQEDAEPRFLRFDADPTGGGTLETSIVRYANDEGVTVDLIGAVHVGDHAYYDLLNERFKQYDSLLYEMVKPRNPESFQQDGLNLIQTLQKAMQTVLELDYQLDVINYRAENFVHADMDLETFMARQAEKGEGFLEMMLQQMLNDMTRPPDPDYQPPTIMEIMEALGAPDRARQLKLLFARELSQVDKIMESMAGPEGSVILDERNEKAIEVLEERIDAGDTNLGIFYGAAHLQGMEDLLEQRGFHMAGEPEWIVAWDMTLDNRGRQANREKLRKAIVAEAVADGQVDATEVAPVEGADDKALRQQVTSLRSENEALRKENEALREQMNALRQQVEALRQQMQQ